MVTWLNPGKEEEDGYRTETKYGGGRWLTGRNQVQRMMVTWLKPGKEEEDGYLAETR